MSKPQTNMRLDRLLSGMGYGSRREIHLLAEAGDIVLDGRELLDASERIALSPNLPERMTVLNEPLDPPPGLVLMLHKPLGVTCSHKDAGKLVYDLLPPRWRMREPKISTVGRLDKDTSGLLLLTDDGDFLHRVISPKHHVPKRYLAILARPLDGSEVALFASGTHTLEDDEKPLAPAHLEILTPTTARLTVTEGRYHQVRRMFASVGNHVEQLHRESVGGLVLPEGLAAGKYQLLTPEAVEQLFLCSPQKF